MSARTGIEWCDSTWNPTVGCSIVSPGCTNCYAMKMAARIERMNPAATAYKGLTRPSKAGPVWTGTVRWAAPVNWQPFHWKQPRRIFVNSMSDLFHEDIPDSAIDDVFAVMALTPRHTYQVLTKRPERMRRYFETSAQEPIDGIVERRDDVAAAAFAIREEFGLKRGLMAFTDDECMVQANRWPLPNVWLGVSVEDQTRADERIPHLLATPAAKRFLSCEPLLGAVDLTAIKYTAAPGFFGDALQWHHRGKSHEDEGIAYPAIDWVIAGGESGPAARPMHPDWARSLRDQCQAAGVPFFFKQWGEWLPGENWAREPSSKAKWQDGEIGQHSSCKDRPESRTPEWRHFGEVGTPGAFALRLGKGRAGATLDGREWREFPA